MKGGSIQGKLKSQCKDKVRLETSLILCVFSLDYLVEIEMGYQDR